ncbi:MAG TPA: LysE family transporter [Thermoplasmata archaeon]|nr:LysE family transporter [Thermoplasmata archaeon]
MSDVLFDLAFGLLLGFSLTIPPGPMNAFIASQSVRAFREGVTAGFGAMCADLVLGVLVFLVHSAFDLSSILRWIYVLGAGVMLYLGVSLIRRASRPPVPGTTGLATFAKAFGLGVSNPFQIIWWLSVGLAFAYLGGWVLFVGLFGAIAVWILFFPAVLHAGAENRPRLAKWMVAVSGALIVAFAAYFVVLAV